MDNSVVLDRVIQEIRLIPNHKLDEMYDLIHYFRLGLENSSRDTAPIMALAGSWQDLTEANFQEFMQEIRQPQP